MAIRKIFEWFLDLLLPRTDGVRLLEGMNAAELRAAARSRAAAEISSDAVILFDYRWPLIKQAVWELKYRGNKKIARLLAACLYEELTEELADRQMFERFNKPLLLPIPLSKKRLRERGFNQCELLTNELEKMDEGNYFFEVRKNILAKVKNTESQTRKNRLARLENLRGCFAVKTPAEIAGRNVVLLDDVVTTGATLNEARRTLLASGARKVLFLAVAH